VTSLCPGSDCGCNDLVQREHIRRFGQYVLDMDVLPLPLNP